MTKIFIMKTVYTKEQLEETLKKGEKALVKGSLASEIRKKYETRKKVAIHEPEGEYYCSCLQC